MLHPNFAILAAIINFAGGLSYLILTIKGKTQPNRVTWFLWALAPMIAFSAELGKGVGAEALFTFSTGFNPLLIFLASFINKHSTWKLSKLDYVYGSLSLLGLLLWQLTGEGNLAITFAIFSDGLAAVPTLIKSYHEPESESYYIFLTGMFTSLLTILSLSAWDYSHIAFPLYIFSICTVLFILIKFKIGNYLKPNTVHGQ